MIDPKPTIPEIFIIFGFTVGSTTVKGWRAVVNVDRDGSGQTWYTIEAEGQTIEVPSTNVAAFRLREDGGPLFCANCGKPFSQGLSGCAVNGTRYTHFPDCPKEAS